MELSISPRPRIHRERRADSSFADDRGQGLIEFALTVPLLLLLLIGVVDLGRGFYHAIGISSATRTAALSASRDPQGSVSQAAVRQKVCNETGWVAFGDAGACSSLTALQVTCTVAGGVVTVGATYRYPLVSFYLAPFLGNPAATSVATTFKLSTDALSVPCSQP
jgi:Flp pilus assembly protein TadG